MHSSRSISRSIGILTLLCCGLPGTAAAFTPESDTVQAIVKRAVRYLTSDIELTTELKALSAMAVYKSGADVSHPLIVEALRECVERCHSVESISSTFDIYATSVVGLLFCEVDSKKYVNEITNVIRSLEERQKPFGGWGYPKPQSNWEYGDTSMTQYAVLCSWLAGAAAGVDMSRDSIRDVTNWLIRTQDPAGAWGYQGKDPGDYARRVPQEEVRHSLCAAGLGSLYICSTMLGFTSADGALMTDEDVPAALKPVVEARQQVPDGQVDKDLLRRAIRDGDRWYQANYRINPEEYALYYLYTLERYQSFKELAERRVSREPRWYNDGVRFLRSTQDQRGYWDDPNGTNKVADTAFAVLFLMRSAKRTIAKASDEFRGLLIAGQGLPSNTKDIQLKEGRVVKTPFQGTASALLEILNNQDHPDFEAAAQAEAVDVSEDAQQRTAEIRQMQRLARAESFKARLLAVKTLARLRDLDQVPTLIYALSDPDGRVVKAARDGLRFSSRKFKGFGLPDEPTAEERRQAISDWKTWYRSIRPETSLELGED